MECSPIIECNPKALALGTDSGDLKGFPGFVMQAAKSASADWTEQESESYEDTTKIICNAIPTNKEFKDEHNPNILPESTMGMVGKDVRLLSSKMTERVFNGDLKISNKNVISVGHLIRDKNVDILVNMEDMIKTHFGVFGFTGVGKSNLMSTLVSNLLSTEQNLKIVLFDLLDEYTGLLIDQILKNNGKIVCLGEKTLMKPVFDYVNNPSPDKLESAVKIFLKNILLPKGLKEEKDKFKPSIEKLLKNEKIKIFEKGFSRTVEDFLTEVWSDVEEKFGSTKKGKLREMKNEVFGKNLKDELTPELAKDFMNKLGFGKDILVFLSSVQDVKKDTEMNDRVRYTLVAALKQIAERSEIEISKHAKIGMEEIIEGLNDEDKKSLYLIISHDSHEVRRFANDLGRYLFINRRISGRISPLVLCIFDEADQFIPGTPRSESEQLSKYIIETLTRRGRKFGIGVGIATQRSSYLDTNIMGQLHTYFISKLPRQYDRNVVGEAFSLDPDQFIQTFKFQPGQWLLVSHQAAGIEIPIPIRVLNAENRIKECLSSS